MKEARKGRLLRSASKKEGTPRNAGTPHPREHLDRHALTHLKVVTWRDRVGVVCLGKVRSTVRIRTGAAVVQAPIMDEWIGTSCRFKRGVWVRATVDDYRCCRLSVNVPETTSATMVHVGDNWLSEQEWFTDRIQTQTYERNEFGEVYDNSIDPSMTDEALGCSPGYYNVDLDYSRNSAGQLTGISGDQGLQISSDNGSTTPSYTKSSVSGRSFTYDGLGRMERRYADVTLLDGDCGSDCLGGAHSGYQYNLQERDVEYVYDAWGRPVEETIKVTQTEFTQDCSNPTSGTELVWSNYELERIYDGYGRLVYSEAPMNGLFNASRELGLYHAYAGGQRIMTAESGGSSNEESFEELFPGAGGQVDKYYRSRSGSGWGNVGSGFATNLYDVTGNVFLSNGSACSSPPFDGGECAFPTYGRLWTVSLERVAPTGEGQLGDDSPYMLQESDGPEGAVIGETGGDPVMLSVPRDQCQVKRLRIVPDGKTASFSSLTSFSVNFEYHVDMKSEHDVVSACFVRQWISVTTLEVNSMGEIIPQGDRWGRLRKHNDLTEEQMSAAAREGRSLLDYGFPVPFLSDTQNNYRPAYGLREPLDRHKGNIGVTLAEAGTAVITRINSIIETRKMKTEIVSRRTAKVKLVKEWEFSFRNTGLGYGFGSVYDNIAFFNLKGIENVALFPK